MWVPGNHNHHNNDADDDDDDEDVNSNLGIVPKKWEWSGTTFV